MIVANQRSEKFVDVWALTSPYIARKDWKDVINIAKFPCQILCYGSVLCARNEFGYIDITLPHNMYTH